MFIEHTCPAGQSNHPAVAQNAFLLWKVSQFLFQAYVMKDSALLCFGSSGAEDIGTKRDTGCPMMF